LPINREASKRLATALIVIGVIMAPDVIIPTFTDFINVGLAMLLADIFGMTFLEGLMLTFTIAFTMIAAGLLIYPYNTKKLLIGKMKLGLKLMIANPAMVIAAVILLLVLYWYGGIFYDTIYQQVKDYALTLVNGGMS